MYVYTTFPISKLHATNKTLKNQLVYINVYVQVIFIYDSTYHIKITFTFPVIKTNRNYTLQKTRIVIFIFIKNMSFFIVAFPIKNVNITHTIIKKL